MNGALTLIICLLDHCAFFYQAEHTMQLSRVELVDCHPLKLYMLFYFESFCSPVSLFGRLLINHFYSNASLPLRATRMRSARHCFLDQMAEGPNVLFGQILGKT